MPDPDPDPDPDVAELPLVLVPELALLPVVAGQVSSTLQSVHGMINSASLVSIKADNSLASLP